MSPHPVVWIGWLIDRADGWRMHITQRPAAQFVVGLLLLLALGGLAAVLHVAVGWLIAVAPGFGWVLHVAIVVVLLAQKSLHDHVEAVGRALDDSIDAGRTAVAMIVGRDVRTLDETGVSSAAIESLAENASDGIVAPALWYALGGIGGIVFYKMVNTADSMIGHRTVEHAYFGKAAARLDDAMNWPAARMMALLVVIVTACTVGWEKARHVLRASRRDAPHHRSPNAGWPETAFAAALDIRLGGPRAYTEGPVAGAWLNEDGRPAETGDIDRALRLFWRCCSLLLILVLAVGVLARIG